MAEFTEMQRKELLEQGNEILAQMTEGVHLRDIMSKIYVDNLEEKTVRQGEVMADSICAGVRKFDRDYSAIQKNPEAYVDRLLKETDAGSTGAERCTFWLRFAATINGMMAAKDGTISEEVQAEIGRMQVTEEMATAELEEELKQKAKEAILNSNLLMAGLTQYLEQMEKTGSGNEAAEILMDFGSKEFEYRAVVAMIAYTKIKSGEYSNIAADISAEQVATLVCTEIETVRIAEKVGKGEMSDSTAAQLFYFLGVLVICALAALAIAGGLGFMGISLEGISLASSFTLKQILIIIGWTSIVFETFKDTAEAWESRHDDVFVKEKAKGAVVARGFQAMAEFAHDKVLAPVSQRAQALWMEIRESWQRLCTGKTKDQQSKTEDEIIPETPEEETNDAEENRKESQTVFA